VPNIAFGPKIKNKGKSGSTVIDCKFAKLLCHTEPTLPSAMIVYTYYTVSLKKSPTFLAVTEESIGGFS